jgi:Xaa-Pro aminopeptidase
VNRRRVDDGMVEAGLDAIVAGSRTNVRYLTGYDCWIASRWFWVVETRQPSSSCDQ